MFDFNEDKLHNNSHAIFIYLISCCVLIYLGAIMENAIILYLGISGFCLFLIIIGTAVSIKVTIKEKDYKQLGILLGFIALIIMTAYGIKRDILN